MKKNNDNNIRYNYYTPGQPSRFKRCSQCNLYMNDDEECYFESMKNKGLCVECAHLEMLSKVHPDLMGYTKEAK